MKSLIAIILILISVGMFFFQINPQYTDIKLLRAESDQYDKALKTAEELKAIRGELSKKLDSFSQEELESLEHFMPQRLDTVRLILDVNGVASVHGIELKTIQTTDSAKAGAPSAAQPPFNVTTMTFNFNNTYENGRGFIQDLERSLKLIDITSVEIKSSEGKPGLYDFGLTFNTYWVGKK